MRKKLFLPLALLAAAVFSVGALSPALAVVPPSIEGGDFYQVKNLTKGGGYATVATADKCEELQYRVQIHNPGPDEPAHNVVVKVTLPAAAATQNVSTATISASNTVPPSVTDTATVNLAAAYKIAYVPGSAQLLDASGNSVGAIGDPTAGAGVSIGTVGISINQQRFVIFRAQVECPQPPPPVKNFACTALNVTAQSRTQYKFTAVASVQNVTIQNYVFTVKNQSGNTVDTKTVTTSATTADYDFNQSQPSTYTINAVINTDAGSTDPNVCVKQITVVKEGENPPAPVTPAGVAPPTGLPQAGPADTAAIVVAVSAFSSVAYYVVNRRFSSL